MKILILNGNPGSGFPDFDAYIEQLAQTLKQGHDTTVVTLREMQLRQCTGCRSCWVKTPGECIIPDLSKDVCRHYIHADFALFASPVIMGFTSALLKRATERLIPLLHPHFEIVNDELQHKARYSSYPKIGLLLGKTKDTDKQDIDIITHIYRRIAITLKTSLCLVKLTSDSVKEVAHAINRV